MPDGGRWELEYRRSPHHRPLTFVVWEAALAHALFGAVVVTLDAAPSGRVRLVRDGETVVETVSRKGRR